MGKIKVGILRGGPSSEYDVSLKTGGEVLKHLPKSFHGVDVLLDKNERWFLNGYPASPSDVFKESDLVFNALHGEFGEDGGAQQIFESFNSRYTGSQIVPSLMAMKKNLARNIFSNFGLKIPKALFFKQDRLFESDFEDWAGQVFNFMAPPWVVKPVSLGSSVGISVCRSYPELVSGLENALKFKQDVLVEEFIKGKEATCGVIEDFRGEGYYPLPVVEILPPEGKFFDYDVKYNGSTKEICPAVGFDNSTKIMIEEMAKMAHRALGCRHYSRADFIVSDKGVYLLEVNTLPGLTSQSLYPKAAVAAGLEFPRLLDHLIKLALTKG